jgi:predicted metalloprotease with PDZ domain
MIDTGLTDQTRPIVDDDAFQLMASTALLLPTGHPASGTLALDVDARRILGPDRFATSFGPGNTVHATVSRRQLGKALFMGGRIALDVVGNDGARLGIAYSGLDSSVDDDALRRDAIAIVDSARAFFHDAQPWYLVSVRGGKRRNPKVHIGGGTGKTNAFAMFVRSDLDFGDPVQREQFRWVLAHEYFHQWNGLTLRVAPLPGNKGDDASIYWFSEGFTEFYAMRLLTRAGLQAPARSIKVLDSKLAHYDANSKRDLDAVEAAKLFWSSDRDGEQIPYLRGYLAAWYADLAITKASNGSRSLDDAMRQLVQRAQRDPDFRGTTANLVSALGREMGAAHSERLERFVVEGGQAPFRPDSFAPCLAGRLEPVSGRNTLQFHFADPGNEACFQH